MSFTRFDVELGDGSRVYPCLERAFWSQTHGRHPIPGHPQRRRHHRIRDGLVSLPRFFIRASPLGSGGQTGHLFFDLIQIISQINQRSLSFHPNLPPHRAGNVKRDYNIQPSNEQNKRGGKGGFQEPKKTLRCTTASIPNGSGWTINSMSETRKHLGFRLVLQLSFIAQVQCKTATYASSNPLNRGRAALFATPVPEQWQKFPLVYAGS